MRSHGIGDHSDKSYQSKPPARGRSNLTSCIQTLTVLSISNNQDQDHRDKISVVTMSSSPSPLRGGEYCASREEEDLVNCLVMLSSNGSFIPSTFENNNLQEGNKAKEMEINNNNNNKGLFQCKADGVGVRPQHFDYSLPFPPPAAAATALSRKRSRVHQCSICHRIS
nr:zinc finger protein ZAT1-like [Ipomoea batatas]